MNTDLRKRLHLMALCLLLGQFASLIFCGDADCLKDGSSENCATLLCSILDSHTTAPAQEPEPERDCRCVCHLQFSHTDAVLFELQLEITGQIADNLTIRHLIISPLIDHPPTV